MVSPVLPVLLVNRSLVRKASPARVSRAIKANPVSRDRKVIRANAVRRASVAKLVRKVTKACAVPKDLTVTAVQRVILVSPVPKARRGTLAILVRPVLLGSVVQLANPVSVANPA